MSPLCSQADPVKFRADLINIAKTTLSSKLLNQEKAFFGTCLPESNDSGRKSLSELSPVVVIPLGVSVEREVSG